MKLSEMTKDERSLLLYIETCAVDNGGLVHCQKINTEDREILKRWDKDGFVSFSRITFKSLELLVNKHCTDLVRLSEDAWILAHEERRTRAARMSAKSPYCDLITTKTKRADFIEAEDDIIPSLY